MKWNYITKMTLKRLLFTFVVIMIAAALRIWPLGMLESKVLWLTFYPAVTLVSLYSGIIGGVIATGLSCIIVINFWWLLVAVPFIQTNAEWMSLGVFVLTCLMIAMISESMRQSNILAKEAEKKAKVASEAKGAFLANMSHELRTPLNSIMGYSQLMQRDSALSKENLRNLAIINSSGEHLLSLINDILEITKIESRKSILNLNNFDFRDLMSHLEEMFRLKADAKGIAFTISGLDKIPRRLYGDSLKIKAILINLVENAIKFTDKGAVNISLEALNKVNRNFRLHVEVKDTGAGISKDDMTKLFKFFSQTESGKAIQTGTGMGLAISQEYANLMDGRIDVVSEVSAGSTFRMNISLKEASEADLFEAAHSKIVFEHMDQNSRWHILVADDNQENRELLIKLLKLSNFNVDSAENGEEAVEKFKILHYDFIWMDIRMPKMDGLEATKIIKELDQEMKTKVVALSAHVFEEERGSITAAGCDDFLAKPFYEKDIYLMMAKHLNLKYSDIMKQTADEEYRLELSSLDVAGIDQLKLVRLHHAIILLDSDRILQAIADIGFDNARVASLLEEEALKMNYTKILRLVEGTVE